VRDREGGGAEFVALLPCAVDGQRPGAAIAEDGEGFAS
jgi:hypothetical protein